MSTDTASVVADHHMRVDLVSSKPKKVLIVVANPSTSTTLGWPVGFWAAELTHPYLELTERGIEVTIASPNGGKVEFDAIMVAGGQSPMFTFRENERLKDAIRHVYESEKPTAVYCHGTAALVDVKLSDGSYLVDGKTVTGFANIEEDYGDSFVGQKIMPWRVEDALKERGANYVQGGLFKSFVIRDGRLITGQQQYSGRKVALTVIEALGG